MNILRYVETLFFDGTSYGMLRCSDTRVIPMFFYYLDTLSGMMQHHYFPVYDNVKVHFPFLVAQTAFVIVLAIAIIASFPGGMFAILMALVTMPMFRFCKNWEVKNGHGRHHWTKQHWLLGHWDHREAFEGLRADVGRGQVTSSLNYCIVLY